MNPEYNPFAAELTAIGEKIKSNSALNSCTRSELAWYEHFDNEGTHTNLNTLQRVLRNTDGALKKLMSKLNAHEATVSEHAHKARKGFNPLHWMSAERRVAIRMHQEALQAIAPIKSEYNSLLEMNGNYTREVQNLQEAMNRYRSFDVLKAEDMVRFLSQEQESLAQKFDLLSQRAKNAESILKPTWELLQGNIEEEQLLQADIREAVRMEGDMAGAPNDTKEDRAKRKLIHIRCRDLFKEDNPSSIREKKQRKLNSIRNSIEKIRKRLEIDTLRLKRDVRMVVVDGSNLLNKRGHNNDDVFIGLAALDALIPILVRKVEKVIVFFDHGATRKLGMAEEALCERFSRKTSEVIVTPQNLPADDTILAVANKNPHAYVISRDRYHDYTARYSWIKDRVFAPVIVNNTLHLHDMFLEVPLASDQ